MAYEYGSHRVGSNRVSKVMSYARGGAVPKHADATEDRKLIGKVLAEKGVEIPTPGPPSKQRFDKPVRGFKRGGGVKEVTINIGKQGPDVPATVPPAIVPPAIPPAALAGPPPGPPMPPPGPMAGLPPGPPPGAVPRFKRGGRIPHMGESKKGTEAAVAKAHNKRGYASGGRVHTYPKMTAGGDSGLGRLERARKYGDNARKS